MGIRVAGITKRFGDSRPWVQLTRAQADALDLTEHGRVWLRGHRTRTRFVPSCDPWADGVR